MSTKTKKEHYVNNKEFLEAMIKYRKSVRKAKRQKKGFPPAVAAKLKRLMAQRDKI